MKFVGLLWLSLVCLSAGASPLDQVITLEGLSLPIPLQVEFQGGLGQYDEKVLTSILEVVHKAVSWCHGLAPKHSNSFFAPPSPRPSRYSDYRTFGIILTDKPQVTFDGEVHSFDPNANYVAFGPLLPIPNDSGYSEHLRAVIRVDRLVYRSDGKPHKLAVLNVAAALMAQIYGFWQVHLDMPIHKIRQLSLESPNELEILHLRSGFNYFQQIIRDSRIFDLIEAGHFLGKLQALLLSHSEQLSVLTKKPEGPFEIPMSFDIGESTARNLTPGLQELLTDTFFRALHLATAVPPETAANLVSCSKCNRKALQGKFLRILLGELKDPGIDNELNATPMADTLRWLPHETFVHKVIPLHPDLPSSQIFRLVLWSDRLIYNSQAETPSRLANTTVAIASELYGKIQSEIFGSPKDSVISINNRRNSQLSSASMNAAIEFVDRLETSPYWRTLTEDEQKDFQRARGLYQMRGGTLTRCAAFISEKKRKGEN